MGDMANGRRFASRTTGWKRISLGSLDERSISMGKVLPGSTSRWPHIYDSASLSRMAPIAGPMSSEKGHGHFAIEGRSAVCSAGGSAMFRKPCRLLFNRDLAEYALLWAKSGKWGTILEKQLLSPSLRLIGDFVRRTTSFWDQCEKIGNICTPTLFPLGLCISVLAASGAGRPGIQCRSKQSVFDGDYSDRRLRK